MDRSISFSINHMTAVFADLDSFIQMAQELGVEGVEFRNDLAGPLFDGQSPSSVKVKLEQAGLVCHALAEIKSFDTLTDDQITSSIELLDVAKELGAEAVSFIPDNGGNGFNAERFREILKAFSGPLRSRNLLGFVEPLGFETCGLRFKSDAVEAFEELALTDCFKLVHDTFHHYLAGEDVFFPQHTGLVHISGVADQSVSCENMTDAHRGLIGFNDRLNNIEQIRALLNSGYRYSFSFEVFDPAVQADPELADRIGESMSLINASLLERAA